MGHKGRTAAAARSTSSEPKGSYYHLNEKAQAASGLVKLVAATSDDSESLNEKPRSEPRSLTRQSTSNSIHLATHTLRTRPRLFEAPLPKTPNPCYYSLAQSKRKCGGLNLSANCYFCCMETSKGTAAFSRGQEKAGINHIGKIKSLGLTQQINFKFTRLIVNINNWTKHCQCQCNTNQAILN